eukprot:10844380-Alexandrium_andersonii.AAC.1
MVLRNPWRSFKEASIVHPAVGTVMKKRTAAVGRPKIGDSIVRLQRMWETALGSSEASILPCSLCKQC